MLCFRFRIAELKAENLDQWTQDRVAGVPRLSLVEWELGGLKDKKERRKALSTEEELRTQGVATKDLCNNLIMLFFLFLFFWIILKGLLVLTVLLFLLPIIFVEDHEDIENIVLEVGIENYEDVENGEFESESEYESEYDEEE